MKHVSHPHIAQVILWGKLNSGASCSHHKAGNSVINGIDFTTKCIHFLLFDKIDVCLGFKGPLVAAQLVHE